MCLKNFSIVSKMDRIEGFKRFQKADDRFLVFNSAYHDSNTGIVLSYIRGKRVTMEYEGWNSLFLKAENSEKYYPTGIHIYLNRPIVASSDDLIISVSSFLDVYTDSEQACSVGWLIDKIECENKEYNYLALMKVLEKGDFNVCDYWTIGNTKKELLKNIQKFRKLWKGWKIVKIFIADMEKIMVKEK